MKQQTDGIRIPLTRLQIIGILLGIAGLAMLFGFGMTAYHYATRDPDMDIAAYQEEIDAGIEIETVRDTIRRDNQRHAAGYAPMIVLGGIMVIACPPLFYASCAEGILLRRRRREEADENARLVEEALADYDDDEFAFITDPNIRARLIRERDERRGRNV